MEREGGGTWVISVVPSARGPHLCVLKCDVLILCAFRLSFRVAMHLLSGVLTD